MIDSHTHIGQFNDLYTSPQEVLDFMDAVGVESFAVSSTTTCERNFSKVIAEMKEIVHIAESRALPVLWILPEMFESDTIGQFLDSGINWRILKIHPQISPVDRWASESNFTHRLISLARKMSIPILLHTGEIDGCYPKQFKEVICGNPDIRFILAHGRPIGQTVEIMQINANVWCDTAFMPTGNIVRLCGSGLSDRILWGTDYPIPQYFHPNKDMKEYYLSNLSNLKSSVSEEDFTKITEHNAQRIFNI